MDGCRQPKEPIFTRCGSDKPHQTSFQNSTQASTQNNSNGSVIHSPISLGFIAQGLDFTETAIGRCPIIGPVIGREQSPDQHPEQLYAECPRQSGCLRNA